MYEPCRKEHRLIVYPVMSYYLIAKHNNGPQADCKLSNGSLVDCCPVIDDRMILNTVIGHWLIAYPTN